MRISDWSSDVCSSDLSRRRRKAHARRVRTSVEARVTRQARLRDIRPAQAGPERVFYNKWLGEFCRVARPLPFPLCITAPLASQHEGDGMMADNMVSPSADVRSTLRTPQRTARQIDITKHRTRSAGSRSRKKSV